MLIEISIISLILIVLIFYSPVLRKKLHLNLLRNKVVLTLRRFTFRKKTVLITILLFIIPFFRSCDTIQVGIPAPAITVDELKMSIKLWHPHFNFLALIINILIFIIVLCIIFNLGKSKKYLTLIRKIDSGFTILLAYLTIYFASFFTYLSCVVNHSDFCENVVAYFTFPLMFPGVIGMFFGKDNWIDFLISVPSIISGLAIFFYIGFKNSPMNKKNFIRMILPFLVTLGIFYIIYFILYQNLNFTVG